MKTLLLIHKKASSNVMAVFLSFIVLTSSCVVQGWTNDYDKLTDAHKNKILTLKTFQDTSNEFIYKVNGQQLREELRNHSKSIVYIFSNGCSSDLCKPIAVYEDFAAKNGYKLFLVMNGFANLEATLKQPHVSVLFAMDNYYYNEKINYKYSRYFENDLMNRPLNEKLGAYMGSLYFFEGDALIQILKELPKE